MDSGSVPIGVILAGGRGRRLGGAKAAVQLRGRPLISYPLAALRAALVEVVIVAKEDTELPPEVSDVAVWIEPAVPRHPLAGILHALEAAGGRPVLVCAADMPFVTPELVRRVVAADPAGAPAVVPVCGGVFQPLLALYLPAAAPLLEPALGADRALRVDVGAIGPHLIEIDDPRAFENVNTPEDLARAGAIRT